MKRAPVTAGALRSGGALVASFAFVLALGAGTAWGHGNAPLVKRGEQERELRAYETTALGPEHAAEHAAEREAERKMLASWNAMTPAEQDRAADEYRQQVAETTAATAGDPAQVGAWTTAPFPIPNYAIHSVVLPTGKVLFWGYPPIVGGHRDNIGKASIWDPSQGTGPSSLHEVPPPQIDVDGDGDTEAAPIYCSGQSFLSNGDVLVAGGNLVWASDPGDDFTLFAGHNRAFTFDPFNEKWTEQPRMRHGRWYPSQVEMADGRTAILSGYSEQAPGGLYNQELEVFTPSSDPDGVGTMTYQPTGSKNLSTYPHLVTLPDGTIAAAGPDRWDTAILDPGPMSWTESARANVHRDAGNAVLVPQGPNGSWKIMQIGGWDHGIDPVDDGLPPSGDGTWPAQATTESVDLSASSPQWTYQQPQNLGRVSANTVLLPDGSMVTVGGGRAYSTSQGSYLVNDDGRQRQVELYDPATGAWRLGPAQQEDRAYHSTAVLLPDGRVFSGGDDMHPIPSGGGFSSSDTAEIYSPPYMFKGTRPAISSAPTQVSPGQQFTVGSSSANLSKAVLMAPPATTHGADMQQRNVPLQVVSSQAGTGLTVKAPPSYGVAPPGYYMLFLLNSQGVPSVAKWVRFGEPAGGGVLGSGPSVTVSFPKKKRRTRSANTGLLAQVEVDRAASVKLTILARAKGGQIVGRRSTSFETAGALVRSFAVKIKRHARRPKNALVSVEATSTADGSQTSWKRIQKLGR